MSLSDLIIYQQRINVNNNNYHFKKLLRSIVEKFRKIYWQGRTWKMLFYGEKRLTSIHSMYIIGKWVFNRKVLLMEKEYCPECKNELKLTVSAYCVKYSCPVCGKYEKTETNNIKNEGRVPNTNWGRSLLIGCTIYKGRELNWRWRLARKLLLDLIWS